MVKITKKKIEKFILQMGENIWKSVEMGFFPLYP
jgi:hypothetical protein